MRPLQAAMPMRSATSETALARPPFGLAGPHAQTIAASLPVRAAALRRRSGALRGRRAPQVLSLSAGVRLMGYHEAGSAPDKGLVVLLHGWEGSAESSYMLSLAFTLRAAGYSSFRLNFRDHGGTVGLNEGLFHSCRIMEVVDAVAAVQERYAPRRLGLVGFSLGGNFGLRVAVRAAAAGIQLNRVVAVCPVLHPPHTMHALDTGFWGYRRYYLSRWRRSLLAKRACFPDRYSFGDLRRFKTLTAMTEFFVREYTQFDDIDSYLNGYSILGPALSGLTVPSHAIVAADDPIIPSSDLAELAYGPKLSLTLSAWGGHCGFVTDYRLSSCIDAMVLAALEA